MRIIVFFKVLLRNKKKHIWKIGRLSEIIWSNSIIFQIRKLKYAECKKIVSASGWVLALPNLVLGS